MRGVRLCSDQIILVFFLSTSSLFFVLLSLSGHQQCRSRHTTSSKSTSSLVAKPQTRNQLNPMNDGNTFKDKEEIIIEMLENDMKIGCEELEILSSSPQTIKVIHTINSDVTYEEWIVTSDGRNEFNSKELFTYKQSNSPDSFKKLRTQIIKMRRHQVDGMIRFYGSCYNDTFQTAGILTEHISAEMIPLCDTGSRDINKDQCLQLGKLRSLISSDTSNIRKEIKLLNIATSFFCLISNLERQSLFLENFHGTNFLINSTDFTVKLADVSSMIYHGEMNIYGYIVCQFDYHCGSPLGWYWSRGSTNRYFYQYCFLKNLCIENRCLGFNASLHLCALRRWIIPLVVSQLKKENQRIGDEFNGIIRSLDGYLSSTELRSRDGIAQEFCKKTSDLQKKVEES